MTVEPFAAAAQMRCRLGVVLPHLGRIAVVGLNFATERTGIAPYTTKLTTALAEIGAEVFVLTTLPHYPQWEVLDGYNQWRPESK